MIFDWWKHRCTGRGWFIGSSVNLLIDQSSMHRNRFKNAHEICMRCVNASQTQVLSLQSRAAQVSSSCSLTSVDRYESNVFRDTRQNRSVSLHINSVNEPQAGSTGHSTDLLTCVWPRAKIEYSSNFNQCKTQHSSFRCLVAHKVRWRCSRCHCILMLLFFEPVQMKPLDTFIILWKERNIKTDHMNKWCVSAMMNLDYSISLKRLGQRRAVLRYVLFS